MMERIRSLARRHPTVVDALGAVALYVLCTAEFPEPALDDRSPAALILLAVVDAALAPRRVRPLWTLVVTTLGVIPAVAIGSDLEPFLVPAAIATYTFVSRTDRRAAVSAASLVILAVALLAPDLSWESLGRFAFVGMAAAIGEAVRNRRAYVAAIEERVARAERTREEEARRRVAEERLHIARELHDVIAHHIAVINVQAGAAAHLVATRPAAATEALGHVRRASRSVLDELSGLLGVLRRPEESADDTDDTEPAPGLARLAPLVETFRASGLDLRWTSTGEARPLPATVDLVAYRVVQEALTNAHRHGTGTVLLSVSHTPAELTLEITNPLAAEPRPGGTGLGLIGMRERAGAVGGTIRAGIEPDQRFHVHVTMPSGKNP
jgi:signal transduction histidine kinase